jgi:recombinational DNA repair protein RecT
MRSGLVANIHADKICENDVFECNKGFIEKHVPNYRQDRGEAYAYYANITFKDGTEKSEVMTLGEVTAISKRSKAVQYYDSRKKKGEYASETPWQTDFDEMAKKTVFKRCSKWVPLSPEVRDAVEKDDEDYIDIQASTIPDKPRKSLLERPQKQESLPESTGAQEPEKKPESSLVTALEGKPVTLEQIESYLKKTGKLMMTMSLENNKTLCKMIMDNPDKVCNDCLDYLAKEGGN